jgi:alpha-beta hydrolase superfamily lysophospholipase
VRQLAVLLLAIWPAGAARAQFDSTLGEARAAAIEGLYELADGRVAVVLDLVDQVRVHQLSLMEPASGRVRALYAVEGDSVFRGGSAWFRATPEQYRVRFTASGGAVDSVYWYEGGRVVPGRHRQWRRRPVKIDVSDAVLSGEVLLPDGEGPAPGLLMVQGSGPLTRRSPRFFAQLFVRAGFAVLVYDKRGTGSSTGSWEGTSLQTQASDVQAALATLRAQPEVDADRVGIHAASEGGYIAPLAAAEDGHVQFLVCRVCPGLPPRETILFGEANSMKDRGLPQDSVADAIEYLRLQIDFALTGQGYDRMTAMLEQVTDSRWVAWYGIRRHPPDAPYWERYRGLLDVDPREIYARLPIPTLVVLGEDDSRIELGPNRTALETAAARAGNHDFTVRVLPGASHGLLLSGPDGAIDRYVPEFHIDMVRWAARRAGLRSDGAGRP